MGKKKNVDNSVTLLVHLELEDATQLTQFEYECAILSALDSLHGQIGSAINFDIESYDQGFAKLTLNKSDMIKFWSALSLYGYYEGKRCAFRVAYDCQKVNH
ncbi:ribonuclease P protein subunit p14 [Hydra vulgaris]|uniref:Ribonuclease P protein subunit p14 n=1 Tax=Hydra vulgaris TaxID=6087 RepID=A0ABM4D9T3_HYDVU